MKTLFYIISIMIILYFAGVMIKAFIEGFREGKDND